MRGAHGDVLALGALDAGAHLFLLPLLATSLLLSADLLTGTFAGARIGVRALAANRKPLAMAQTAIATYFHKALHVLGNLAMQVAFDLEVRLNVVAQLRQIVLCEIFHANIGVNPGVCKEESS